MSDIPTIPSSSVQLAQAVVLGFQGLIDPTYAEAKAEENKHLESYRQAQATRQAKGWVKA